MVHEIYRLKGDSDKDQAELWLAQLLIVAVEMLIVGPTLFSDDIPIFERYQHAWQFRAVESGHSSTMWIFSVFVRFYIFDGEFRHTFPEN